MGTAQGLFHFTEGALAYAGPYLHDHDSPVHTHSFVEIAFAVSGDGHSQLPGRAAARCGPATSVLLAARRVARIRELPAAEVYNCCFSSELLRRELAWTREDPLLGYLLWAGPYSSPARGVLTISLVQRPSTSA